MTGVLSALLGLLASREMEGDRGAKCSARTFCCQLMNCFIDLYIL